MIRPSLSLPPPAKGLSARLLILTIAFVMLAEVLIYAPSIARFYRTYLEERAADGHLAILALEATPDHTIGEDLERELLDHVGARAVALAKPGAGKLMLMASPPSAVDATYDLRETTLLTMMGAAFGTLIGDGEGVIRAVAPSATNPDVLVEVVVDEGPLRTAMVAYSNRILGLSLVISVIAAALVYLTLHLLLVRPMQRLTESMMRFREDPEDASRVVRPSSRSDEVGVMERELASMQQGLRGALQQKAHLAALGTAVTKINHDLRNILATARLVSDRLASSEDPQVQRIAPTLFGAIDRAINLCEQTLDFTRQGAPRVEPQPFDLNHLIADVEASLALPMNGQPALHAVLPGRFPIVADREQLHRVFTNLARNAVEAGATRIEVTASAEADRFLIDVSDNGPGLPPRARDHLFQPFSGSSRPGGMGLGLAIARELVRAHGGDLRLERSTAEGSCFRLTLPSDHRFV